MFTPIQCKPFSSARPAKSCRLKIHPTICAICILSWSFNSTIFNSTQCPWLLAGIAFLKWLIEQYDWIANVLATHALTSWQVKFWCDSVSTWDSVGLSTFMSFDKAASCSSKNGHGKNDLWTWTQVEIESEIGWVCSKTSLLMSFMICHGNSGNQLKPKHTKAIFWHSTKRKNNRFDSVRGVGSLVV